MDIKYLKMLSDNPVLNINNSDYKSSLLPLEISDISQLETEYNEGKPFPLVLRELLFLAGKDCYVLDYGGCDTQKQMQESAREWLNDSIYSIDRNFYVIDVYNADDQFLFVYLDDDSDDPFIHDVYFEPLSWRNWTTNLGFRLSDFINKRIAALKAGYNPF